MTTIESLSMITDENFSNEYFNMNDKFYLNNLVRNLRHETHAARIKLLEILLDQVKVVPSSVMLQKDLGGMCLLHRILMTFLYFEQKYDNLTDIIKYVLIRSESNYRDYVFFNKSGKLEQKIILQLLKKFDKRYKSVTFYLRQILNSEEEKFINLMRTSHMNIAPNVAIGNEENFQHILEVTFISGSLETLQLLLEYGLQYHNLNQMQKPILKTVGDALQYVKPNRREKYYECLNFLLKEEALVAEQKRLEVIKMETS